MSFVKRGEKVFQENYTKRDMCARNRSEVCTERRHITRMLGGLTVPFSNNLVFTKRKGDNFMNLLESDILRAVMCEPFINQRILSEASGHSLGVVNRSLKRLMEDGYLVDSKLIS